MTTRPIWSEGLFLRPQHLQAQDASQAAALNGRLDGAQAYPWGIVQLTLSDDLAQRSQFGVNSLVAVLPDGEVVAIPVDLPPPLPFDTDDQVRGEIVYLTLPARQEGSVSFA